MVTLEAFAGLASQCEELRSYTCQALQELRAAELVVTRSRLLKQCCDNESSEDVGVTFYVF